MTHWEVARLADDHVVFNECHTMFWMLLCSHQCKQYHKQLAITLSCFGALI